MPDQQTEATLARRARRLKYLGRLLLAAGILVPGLGQFLLSVGVDVPALGQFLIKPTVHSLFVLVLIGGGLGYTSLFLLYRSRQYAAQTGERVGAPDSRPPILYLRAFIQDMTALKAPFVLPTTIEGFQKSLEEQLRGAVAPIGPLIGVGIPGESLPPLGAHRIYVGDDEWQAKVDTLMQSAALVIILVGKGGGGLEWEIQRAFDTVDPNRLLLLVTRGKRQYEQAVKGIESASGVKLPEYRNINRISGFFVPPFSFHANCFLSFPRKGEVVVLKLCMTFFRGFGQFAAEARYALKPVFEIHGIPWTPPPISIVPVIAALLAVALVLVSIFA